MRLSRFALTDLSRAARPPSGRAGWIRGRIFAHRGLHGNGVPENSASAFRGAIAAGFGIECDIQRSRDDLPMVFHDWDVQRLLGRPEQTEALTASEMKALGYAGTDEGPLDLAEMLELVAGKVPLLIEIKSRHGYDVERTCVRVSETLKGYTGDHAVMSFDPRVSRWFAANSPETTRGLVVTEEHDRGRLGDVKRKMAVRHARPDFLAYDIRDLPSRFAAAQRARGLPVATWTVRNADQRHLAAHHADAPIAEAAGLDGPG